MEQQQPLATSTKRRCGSSRSSANAQQFYRLSRVSAGYTQSYRLPEGHPVIVINDYTRQVLIFACYLVRAPVASTQTVLEH
jgi:hypothetical protein